MFAGIKVSIYAIYAIISYDALNDFVGHYSKRDRHKYQDDEAEKERYELVFRTSSTSTAELFCES